MKHLFSFALLLVPTLLTAQELTPIPIDFFAQVRSLSSLKVNDKGDIFYLQRTAEVDSDRYVTDLYQLKPSGESIALTHDGKQSRFWVVGNDLVKGSDLDSILTAAQPAVENPLKAASVAWIDQQHFFFTSSIQIRHQEEDKRYIVLDEESFRFNGRGITDGKRTPLFYYKEGHISQLTDSTSNVQSLVLSHDGQQLAFTYTQYEVHPPRGNQIHLLQVSTFATRPLTASLEDSRYAQLAWIDHETLFFTRQVVKPVDENPNPQANPSFWKLNVNSLQATEIYDGDLYELGVSLLTDIKTGNPAEVFFTPTGLQYISTSIDYTPLLQLDPRTGKAIELTPADYSLDAIVPYTRSKKENGYLAIATQGTGGQEIWFFDNKTRRLTQLSHINEEVWRDKYVAAPEPISYINRNGVQITGYVLRPLGFDATRRYPTILDIHGGPKDSYGKGFFHEMQYWASLGYVVIFTNPTGGSGYGSDFARLKGQFGDIDYADIMQFVDTAVARCNYIDPDRLGVTGGSYGGLMTNWVIGHTNRFKAAASQRSISNWLSFFTLSDIGERYGESYTGTTPWLNAEELWDQSPVAYADQVTTPTLFIHSEEDYRCPLPEGLQMYSALQQHDVPSRIIIFKNENHELSRNGKPQNRIRRLVEITNWFAKYL